MSDDLNNSKYVKFSLYEVPEAAGRHVCAPHVISARDLLDLLKSMYPDYPFVTK